VLSHPVGRAVRTRRRMCLSNSHLSPHYGRDHAVGDIREAERIRPSCPLRMRLRRASRQSALVNKHQPFSARLSDSTSQPAIELGGLPQCQYSQSVIVLKLLFRLYELPAAPPSNIIGATLFRTIPDVAREGLTSTASLRTLPSLDSGLGMGHDGRCGVDQRVSGNGNSSGPLILESSTDLNNKTHTEHSAKCIRRQRRLGTLQLSQREGCRVISAGPRACQTYCTVPTINSRHASQALRTKPKLLCHTSHWGPRWALK
jgi:hypothetical protein